MRLFAIILTLFLIFIEILFSIGNFYYGYKNAFNSFLIQFFEYFLGVGCLFVAIMHIKQLIEYVKS